MKEFKRYTIESDGFSCSKGLVRQEHAREGGPYDAGGAGSLHVLPAILVGNDREAGGETRKTHHMIAISMRENYVSDRGGGDTSDLIEKPSACRGADLRIDHDDASLTENHTRIGAGSFYPVHGVIHLMDQQ